jgi:hypothetical protein
MSQWWISSRWRGLSGDDHGGEHDIGQVALEVAGPPCGALQGQERDQRADPPTSLTEGWQRRVRANPSRVPATATRRRQHSTQPTRPGL